MAASRTTSFTVTSNTQFTFPPETDPAGVVTVGLTGAGGTPLTASGGASGGYSETSFTGQYSPNQTVNIGVTPETSVWWDATSFGSSTGAKVLANSAAYSANTPGSTTGAVGTLLRAGSLGGTCTSGVTGGGGGAGAPGHDGVGAAGGNASGVTGANGGAGDGGAGGAGGTGAAVSSAQGGGGVASVSGSGGGGGGYLSSFTTTGGNGGPGAGGGAPSGQGGAAQVVVTYAVKFTGTATAKTANATASVSGVVFTPTTGSLTTTLASYAARVNGSVSPTGYISATLAAATFRGTGSAQTSGTLAATTAQVVANISGTAILYGSAATVLADATAQFTGRAEIDSTLSATLDAVTLSASGMARFEGTLSTSLENAAPDFEAAETISGVAAVSLQNAAASVAALNAPRITGTLGTTLDGFRIDIADRVDIHIVGALHTDNLTAALVGAESIPGTLSATTASAVIRVEGDEVISGTLSSTLAAATCNFEVLNAPPDIAVLDATLGDVTVSVSVREAFRRHHATILGTM